MEPCRTRECLAADAKEVGMENPAEKTPATRRKNLPRRNDNATIDSLKGPENRLPRSDDRFTITFVRLMECREATNGV